MEPHHGWEIFDAYRMHHIEAAPFFHVIRQVVPGAVGNVLHRGVGERSFGGLCPGKWEAKEKGEDGPTMHVLSKEATIQAVQA